MDWLRLALLSATGLYVCFFSIRTRESENRVRESEEKYKTLVRNSIDGIYVVQDEKFKYVNPEFVKILGYSSKAELIGMDIR